jgi:hypothetical protein
MNDGQPWWNTMYCKSRRWREGCGAHDCTLAPGKGPDRHAKRDQAQSANPDPGPIQPGHPGDYITSCHADDVCRILGEQNCVFNHRLVGSVEFRRENLSLLRVYAPGWDASTLLIPTGKG